MEDRGKRGEMPSAHSFQWSLFKIHLFLHNKQFFTQSINAAAKLFTSLAGKSFQNWFDIKAYPCEHVHFGCG